VTIRGSAPAVAAEWTADAREPLTPGAMSGIRARWLGRLMRARAGPACAPARGSLRGLPREDETGRYYEITGIGAVTPVLAGFVDTKAWCPRRDLPPLGCSYPSASGYGQHDVGTSVDAGTKSGRGRVPHDVEMPAQGPSGVLTPHAGIVTRVRVEPRPAPPRTSW
jgi:hypothetical protein